MACIRIRHSAPSIACGCSHPTPTRGARRLRLRAGKRDPFAPDLEDSAEGRPANDPVVDPVLDAFERRFPETAKRLDKWLVGPQTLPVLGFSMAEGDKRAEGTKQQQTTRSYRRSCPPGTSPAAAASNRGWGLRLVTVCPGGGGLECNRARVFVALHQPLLPSPPITPPDC
jgi:hypothetical protein